jgi:predicted Kef-type K+ transport protein
MTSIATSSPFATIIARLWSETLAVSGIVTRGSVRSARWLSPRVSRCAAAGSRCFAGCWYAVGSGRYHLLNTLESLSAFFCGWLRHHHRFPHSLGQVLLGVRKHWSCSQNVIVGLMATSCVLLLELTLEFSIFIFQHVIVIKQAILGLLANLVRCCIIKLAIVTRRTFGGDVPIPLQEYF